MNPTYECSRSHPGGVTPGRTPFQRIARPPRFLPGISALLALIGLGHAAALGSSIDLIVGPGGAATLFNSSPSPITLKDYSIDGVNLSPGAWVSLHSQGLSFAESSATSSQLSETTLADGLSLGPGESRSIGHPFVLDLAADANGNGSVDGLDFLFYQTQFGSTGPGGASIGDFNGDQVVDAADGEIWAESVGSTASYTFAATVVPEPSSTALMGIGLALLAARCRK